MDIPTLDQVKSLFNVIKPIVDECGPLLFLGKLILDKEHGDRHGKMGTKSTEEDMWTTAFNRKQVLCKPTCTQADCGILCPTPLSLSIKCTATSIAVNWGKNKEKIDFVFRAPIMIVWHGKTEPGVYIIDPLWCQTNIKLGSNNKTDYMVSAGQVTQMRKRAKEIGMFIPLTPLPDKGEYFIFRNATPGHAWPRLLSDVRSE